ncbi:hypothetical protein Peur_019569 [Populus x canadensis]
MVIQLVQPSYKELVSPVLFSLDPSPLDPVLRNRSLKGEQVKGSTRRFSPTVRSVIGCVLRDRLDDGESLVYWSLGKCKTLLPATGSHAVCRSNKEGLPLEVFPPTKQRL